jgi:hypothetical protein
MKLVPPGRHVQGEQMRVDRGHEQTLAEHREAAVTGPQHKHNWSGSSRR